MTMQCSVNTNTIEQSASKAWGHRDDLINVLKDLEPDWKGTISIVWFQTGLPLHAPYVSFFPGGIIHPGTL